MPDTALANKHLKRAHKAYAKLKYEQVIKHLKRAIKIAKTPEEKVEIFQFLGRMYVMYSKEDEAREAFIEVLKIDPSFELPDDESPKILATLEAARAEAGGVVDGGGEPEPPADETAVDTGGEGTEEIVAAPADDATVNETGPTDPPDPMLTTTATEGSAFYETWWFWTAIGVVVVGAATGATLAVTMKPGPPEGDFGEPIRMP